VAQFATRIPRLFALALALAGFCLVSPETLARGPDLCLWKHLFHLAACPACGSTRALAAFFHGQFAAAFAFNRNVVVTAPLLLGLLVRDAKRLVQEREPKGLPYQEEGQLKVESLA
jgi:hypothetical protein